MSRRSNRTPLDEAGPGPAAEAFELEQQNNRHLDELAGKASALHSITLSIHDEVNDQNRFLDGTSDSFNRFGNMFSRTRQQLDRTLATGNSRFLWYLTALILFVVFMLYYLAKHLLSSEAP